MRQLRRTQAPAPCLPVLRPLRRARSDRGWPTKSIWTKTRHKLQAKALLHDLIAGSKARRAHGPFVHLRRRHGRRPGAGGSCRRHRRFCREESRHRLHPARARRPSWKSWSPSARALAGRLRDPRRHRRRQHGRQAQPGDAPRQGHLDVVGARLRAQRRGDGLPSPAAIPARSWRCRWSGCASCPA